MSDADADAFLGLEAMDAEQALRQLILLSAATAARRSALGKRARDLLGIVDWEMLATALRARRLLGVLGPNLIELAGDRVDAAFAREVREAISFGRRQAALLVLVTARAQATLAQAGIASAALKGPMLAEAIHGDPGRRPCGDIDLLVTCERLPDAVAALRELGYAPPGDHVDRDGLPELHFALAHEREELPPVELHWRIHSYERRFARERLLPAGVQTSPDWRPQPVDQLAALLLFYARDGFVDLRLASDIAAWWDRFGARLHRNALGGVADAYPALGRVLGAAARTAERVVGLPCELLLTHRGALDRRSRLAVRLANPNPRYASRAQMYAEIGLVDGLLTPSGGLKAFARRQLLPCKAVLDQHAAQAQQRSASSPIGHCARVLVRYAPALRRAALGVETLQT